MSVNMPMEAIESKIHTIRGPRVMLDSDLAELYGAYKPGYPFSEENILDSTPGRFTAFVPLQGQGTKPVVGYLEL